MEKCAIFHTVLSFVPRVFCLPHFVSIQDKYSKLIVIVTIQGLNFTVFITEQIRHGTFVLRPLSVTVILFNVSL